jgi:signal transduction histidine kinase
MTTPTRLTLLLAGLLIALTYLLMPYTSPDTMRYDRAFDGLRVLMLDEAALHRDVLKARAGLLRNYDPLVQSVEGLHRAVDTLRSTETRGELNQRIEGVAAAVADQEAVVEVFKSRNALLQNSLSYFAHAIQQFDGVGSQQQNALSTEAGKLANAMVRFIGAPQAGDVAAEVMASLERLSQWPTESANPGVRALVLHGRLIVVTLPAVDDSVSRLLAASMAERTRALQDAYLEVQARAIGRASFFGILLYIAALALVAYVSYLFLRLRANTKILRARVDFERLIVAISAQFINRPLASIDDGINDGLARLATHAGADRAQIIVSSGDETGIRDRYLWSRPGVRAPAGQLDDVLGVALHWPFEQYERQGCIRVADVGALPDGAEKSRLQEHGIRSWLCIPMWSAGKRIGFLTLDAVAGRKHWPDDIELSRTAGEILANAIERQRSESEREMLETRLHQAQRLESIGTLAGGIAHEFNNILGAIFGYAELALATVGKGSRARRHLQGILTAGERAQAVINKVLAFSRRSERRVGLISAASVVAETVGLLRASLPATITIETTVDGRDDAVMADPTELQQVVMNLCTNGAHAMKNHGTLHVRLDTVDIDEALALSHGSLAAGRYVRLAVTDTGSGIDAATLERIFEPFFTTKAVGQGTGLGLSTVHGIVTQYGGALNVGSQLGEGSTFQAYFPRAGEIDLELQDRRTPRIRRGHGETVLIVDDEVTLVPLAEEMLAALGYEAVGFDQSAMALEAFRAAPDRFDLVLTDDIMPDMTGTELAGALHEIRPNLPVILMTGGGRPIASHRLQAAGIREVVRKPLLSATMADVLARHLLPPGGSAERNRDSRVAGG